MQKQELKSIIMYAVSPVNAFITGSGTGRGLVLVVKFAGSLDPVTLQTVRGKDRIFRSANAALSMASSLGIAYVTVDCFAVDRLYAQKGGTNG